VAFEGLELNATNSNVEATAAITQAAYCIWFRIGCSLSPVVPLIVRFQAHLSLPPQAGCWAMFLYYGFIEMSPSLSAKSSAKTRLQYASSYFFWLSLGLILDRITLLEQRI